MGVGRPWFGTSIEPPDGLAGVMIGPLVGVPVHPGPDSIGGIDDQMARPGYGISRTSPVMVMVSSPLAAISRTL